jgi:hypothetical protein
LGKLTTYWLLSTFFLIGINSYGQDTLKSVFRPRIGLGTGVMTYYGEIQNYQKSFSSTVNRYGGLVYANAPISRMFNLELSALYGKISANERTIARNFNFQSQIRMGTVMLYYNFYPLFQENRALFHPFVGFGFSSFEFLSKTDMFDANGQQYYYWNDGAIMNMDQNDPLATTDAVPLVRDYTFETDLREMNLDNLGKYREQNFSMPLTLGVEWHLSSRWDFRISTSYNLLFSDLVDNISPAGVGIREGDQKNDKILFTYVALSYDLQFGKGKSDGDSIDSDGLPMYATWDPNDFDKDGVIDAFDQCPATSIEALVDEQGCPLDTDQDGVADFRDDEPNTKLGSYVNEFGVALTEEDFIKHAKLYYDSTGYAHDFAEFRTEVILNKEKGKYYPKVTKTKTGLTYVIIVGKERKDVTVNDLHKFLGYADYSTMEKGDTIYYTLGEFETIEDAVAAKNGLADRGVDVQEIGRTSGNSEILISVDDKVIEKVERINIQAGKESPEYSTTEQVYRVQLGAFKNKVDTDKVFPGMEVVYGASEKDNINRYYSVAFESYEDAVSYQKEIAVKGFKNTFIVAYEQQKRITLVEAGVNDNKLPKNYTEDNELTTFVEDRDTTATSDLAYDPTRVKYRVKLAYFENDIPIETVNILYNIKRIKPVKGRNGSTTYYSQEFSTQEERDAAIPEFKSYGLTDLENVIEYNGEIYTDEEFAKKFKK